MKLRVHGTALYPVPDSRRYFPQTCEFSLTVLDFETKLVDFREIKIFQGNLPFAIPIIADVDTLDGSISTMCDRVDGFSVCEPRELVIFDQNARD